MLDSSSCRHVSSAPSRASLLLALLGSAVIASACSSSKRYAAEIGPAGGSLVGPGGITIVVPPGAVDTTFTLVASTASGVRRPAGTAGAATAFRLEPEGTTFDKPLEITVPISPTALPAGSTIDDVIVLRADHGSDVFVPLPTRRSGNAVVCDTEHFSDFVAVVLQAGNPFGSCSNGMCDPNESCTSCPLECGLCVGGTDGGVVLDGSVPVDAGTDAGSGPGRFVPTGAGSAIDSRTSLEWELAPPTSLVTQATAATDCTALTTNGQSDWRLPTIVEALAMVDQTKAPAIEVSVFASASLIDPFWTSTLRADNATVAWSVRPNDGSTFSNGLANFPNAYRWCVRGTSTAPAIVLGDNLDGTASDVNAGLTWEKNHGPTLVTLADAQTYCATLSLGGAGGWRLPTLVELMRIARYDLAMPAFDGTLFSTTVNQRTWSSTDFFQSPTTDAWYWEEDYGDIGPAPKNSTASVRCVR